MDHQFEKQIYSPIDKKTGTRAVQNGHVDYSSPQLRGADSPEFGQYSQAFAFDHIESGLDQLTQPPSEHHPRRGSGFDADFASATYANHLPWQPSTSTQPHQQQQQQQQQNQQQLYHSSIQQVFDHHDSPKHAQDSHPLEENYLNHDSHSQDLLGDCAATLNSTAAATTPSTETTALTQQNVTKKQSQASRRAQPSASQTQKKSSKGTTATAQTSSAKPTTTRSVVTSTAKESSSLFQSSTPIINSSASAIKQPLNSSLQQTRNQPQSSSIPAIPDEPNFQFYHEYCRVYIANVQLTNQLKELVGQKGDLLSKFARLEKKSDELGDQDAEDRKKRFRRNASQIDRHYKCSHPSCQKSYGSEGSLNQHLKIKHPELYLGGPTNSGIDSDHNSICNGTLDSDSFYDQDEDQQEENAEDGNEDVSSQQKPAIITEESEVILRQQVSSNLQPNKGQIGTSTKNKRKKV